MNGVLCAVKWCACYAAVESQFCAVHRRHKELRTKLPDVATESADAYSDCAECNGTGDCPECDGEGTHTCEHYRCHDEHDCGACDGTGECEACHGGRLVDDEDESRPWDVQYLAWANDAGWEPWERPQPWEEA